MTGPTRGRRGEPPSDHKHNNTKRRDSSATERQEERERRERERKKSDEFTKYMEHRMLSLLDSCVFTENDGVDPAPGIALPGVRCAVFGVLFQRGGGRGGYVAPWRPPRFKTLFWDVGLYNLGGRESAGKEKEGRKRKVTFVYLLIYWIYLFCFRLEKLTS